MNDILEESFIVKEYEFVEPEIDEVDYLLDKVVKECRRKCFQSFKYRCVYDFKFTNTTNNERNILNISHDCLEYKSEY